MTTSVVLGDDATTTPAAVAGFLAGYCGATRRSYATDLRIFADWCAEGRLELFAVRRAHRELFGRWMEEKGKMRSTVARRLPTLASFATRIPGDVPVSVPLASSGTAWRLWRGHAETAWRDFFLEA